MALPKFNTILTAFKSKSKQFGRISYGSRLSSCFAVIILSIFAVSIGLNGVLTNYIMALAFKPIPLPSPTSPPSSPLPRIPATSSPPNQQLPGNASTPNVSALLGEGDVLFYQGNSTQAIQYYDKALAIDPKDKVALDDKANALFHQSNYTQAIQYYDKALAIDPKDKDALTGKANALSNIGNYTQAIQYYDKALDIDPTDTYTLTRKGDVLDDIGNSTQAIQYYDKALAIDPKYKDALIGRERSGCPSYVKIC